MGLADGSDTIESPRGVVDLYWIPLGAGAHVVRISGRIFEAVSAFAHRRPRCDLYHAALVLSTSQGDFVVEQAPVPDLDGMERGVVAQGPVGLRWLGRWRVFRYEVRCWRDGRIPDLDHAVGGPVRVTDDAAVAARIVDTLPSIPTPVWGRDELGTGEMWNSNSVVAWVLTRSGAPVETIAPPANGRAPGWNAGCTVASRRPRP